MSSIRHAGGVAARAGRISCATLGLVLMLTMPRAASAQDAAPYAVQRGLAIGIEAASTSSWQVEMGPPVSGPATISRAVGLAFTASYGINRWLAPWIAYTASLYGESDPSAISELAGGAELRGQWFRRIVPAASAGLGRTWAPTAGGFRFNHADLALNADVFLTHRLALRGGIHGLIPIGEATDTDEIEGPAFDVADSRIQTRIGLRVHLGRVE